MRRAIPEMRNFAKRLIADDARGNKTSVTKILVDFNSSEKLSSNLGGYHALLSRALALAQAEVPWLRVVRLKADGTLETVEEHHTQRDPHELLEGRVVLLAQLLGLLVAFMGENLTLHLVREVWPKAPVDDVDFGTAEKNAHRPTSITTPLAV